MAVREIVVYTSLLLAGIASSLPIGEFERNQCPS